MKPCSSAAAAVTFILTMAVTLSASAAPPDEPVRFPAAGQSDSGSLGIGRLTQALPGEPGVVRLGLRGGFFQSNAFPGPAAENRFLTGQLAASWTVLPALEVFGAYRFSSNRNSEQTPKIVQAQGDVLIGAKVGKTFERISLGADLRFDLRNGIGSDLPALDGSSIHLRALGSQVLAVGDHPLAVHVNVGGAFGRSDAALDERMTESLLFSTGFSAYHRFLMGLGARYELGFVSPFATLDFDIPLGIDNSVLRAADTSAFAAGTKRITLGAELKTSVSSTLQLAVELGFGSGVPGFAATQPWMGTAAWSFAFDRRLYGLPPPSDSPSTGYVSGRIVDQATSAGIGGALVRAAPDGPPVATDADGRFVSYGLEAGPVTLTIEKEGFVSSTLEAEITVGETVVANGQLQKIPEPPAPPPAQEGFVAGQLSSSNGEVPARVVIEGTERVELETADGRFTARLAPGTHRVTILPVRHLAWSGQVVVSAEQAVPLVVSLPPTPTTPSFAPQGHRLVPERGVLLDETAADADPEATSLLRELVDWLVRHPTQSMLVGVHSDPPAKGNDDRKGWTQKRADELRNALIALGAPADRVQATGFGLEQPIVPSRMKNKAPNRRVEFVVSDIKPVAATPEPVQTTDTAPVVELPPIDEFPMDLPPLPLLPPEGD